MNSTEGILTSIKKLLGIAEDYTQFDADIIMQINSVFMILSQIGIGPDDGFSITGDSETWTDFVDESALLDAVKSYVYLKVKLLFDPPLSSSAVDSIKKMIDEYEWRMNVRAEAPSNSKG